ESQREDRGRRETRRPQQAAGAPLEVVQERGELLHANPLRTWSSGPWTPGGEPGFIRLLRPDPIPEAAQRQLDVDDQGFGGVLELVEATVELVVVGLVGLVGLGQVLEARRPLHQALQAGLAVGVHVRRLRPPEVEAAEEGADLATALLGPLDDARELPAPRPPPRAPPP